jgi:Na+/proline symporter
MVYALAAYLLLNFVVAVWASRSIRTEDDYFVAGRRLGVIAVSMSVFATWFGAETVMGAAGAIASDGLAGGRADPFGYTLCLLLMAIFIAFKLRATGVITFPDFLNLRFGATAMTIAAVLTIPTSLVWASAQLLAMGEIISQVANLQLFWGLVFGTVLIVAYTSLGGLLGDVVTDMLQGTIMIIGLVILLVVVLMSPGFSLAAIEPSQLSFQGFDEEGAPESLLATLDTWMIPILGSLVAQEAISRFLGAKSASVARTGCYIASGLYIVIGSIPLLIGLLGHAAGFETESPDSYLPQLAQTYLHPVLFIILMGAIVSAILSTVDTTLLAISSIASRNLVEPLMPEISDRSKLALGRVMTVASGLIAFSVAASGETIKGLVEIASSFGSAGILVALLIGLHSRFGGEAAAVAALVSGAVLSFTGYGVPGWAVSLFSEEAADSLPGWMHGYEGGFFFAVLGALAAYVVVGLLTGQRQAVQRTTAATQPAV